MALFLKPDPVDGSGVHSGRRSGVIRTQREKGYIWVRQSESDPGLSMLGVSVAAPADKDLAADLATWRIQYYALVDDTTSAMSDASRFLSSFAELSSALDNVYRTQSVIAATAIETSGAEIRFRKSSFARTATSINSEHEAASDDLENTDLRLILEKSVIRRQRANDLVGQLDEYEDVLTRSESITGFKIPTVNGTMPPTAPISEEMPVLHPVVLDEEQRELRNEPRIRGGRERQALPAYLRGEKARPILYKDVEPEQETQLDESDVAATRRMEQLILRREATQNLRQIRHGDMMSLLLGIPVGALIGFALMVVLDLPANNEMLVRSMLAGACAVPLTLFAIRLVRFHGRSSHWRRILRTD